MVATSGDAQLLPATTAGLLKARSSLREGDACDLDDKVEVEGSCTREKGEREREEEEC